MRRGLPCPVIQSFHDTLARRRHSTASSHTAPLESAPSSAVSRPPGTAVLLRFAGDPAVAARPASAPATGCAAPGAWSLSLGGRFSARARVAVQRSAVRTNAALSRLRQLPSVHASGGMLDRSIAPSAAMHVRTGRSHRNSAVASASSPSAALGELSRPRRLTSSGITPRDGCQSPCGHISAT